ncbi:MAG: hypothetical protein WHS89_08540 [Acidimicrobiales bacterium]
MSATPRRTALRPSSPPVRLAVFAFVLVGTFGMGFAVGRAVGPLDAPTTVGGDSQTPHTVTVSDPEPTTTTQDGQHP